MHKAVNLSEGLPSVSAEPFAGDMSPLNKQPELEDGKSANLINEDAFVSDTYHHHHPDEDDEDGEDDEDDASVSLWWGGIGADFRTLAVSIKETAGGVAQFVRTSAWNIAQEIAMLEETRRSCYDNERRHLDDNDEDEEDEQDLHLPWEIQLENGDFLEDEELKMKILQLSSNRNTFLEPFTFSKSISQNTSKLEGEGGDDSEKDFKLDEPRVEIIRQLLKIDPQLSAMHAKLSGRVDVRETTFWRNYFHACSMTRQEHLLLLAEKKHSAEDPSSPAAEGGSHSSPNSLIPEDEFSNDDDEEASKFTDDSSFVCLSVSKSTYPPSAPSSVKTMRSVDSLVLIDTNQSSSLPNLM
jgi:hypothetical protein